MRRYMTYEPFATMVSIKYADPDGTKILKMMADVTSHPSA